MDDKEIAALVGALAPVIKSHVESCVEPLKKRIVELEAYKPKDGKDGQDGKDADLSEVLRRVDERFNEAVEGIIARAAERAGAGVEDRLSAVEARQPVDGKDADEEAITAKIMDAVLERVEAIPVPKDGQPGRDGADADSDEICARVMDAVMAKVAEIPLPKDGAPGRDGSDGKDGADGVGLAGALIDRDGELVVTLTDGQHKKLGVVVGKDGLQGEKGSDGRDGFGFEDMFVEFDGERSATLKFVKGDNSKSFHMTMPTIIDRGVWKEGTYERGDAVSWGGSLWIAQEETSDKPETTKAWRLAVKRGRDGKDGVMKVATPQQPVKVA